MISLRGSTRLCVLVAALGAALTLSAPAWGAFSNAPDPTWQVNGSVRAVVQSGNTIYLGGRFTAVSECPPGSSCPNTTVTVTNVAALDATTGAAITSFSPDVTGDGATVHALVVAGGKLFIGGKFTAVDGQPRTNFAAVDAATGAVDPGVDAVVGDATRYVKALAASSTRVYLGGLFPAVDGVTRVRLAAVDLAGNLDTRWRPRANKEVSSLALSATDGTIYAGGLFRQASGSGQAFLPRETVARFDLATGALHAWAIAPATTTTDMKAFDLASTSTRLFVAYGGTSNRAMAFDATIGGAPAWTLRSDGNFQAIAAYGSQVLLGGHFTKVNSTTRTRFAAVTQSSGRLETWAPAFTGHFLGPWDIAVTGNQVWIGGDFTKVSGVSQARIARFTDR